MNKEALCQRFQEVRQQSNTLCDPLEIEDYVIQSIDDVSPPKWHLAHTTWFFETFILAKYLPTYQSFDPSFRYLYNSYYQGIGTPFPRVKRGLLSRPTVATIYAYRKHVDQALIALAKEASAELLLELDPLIILGLHHEQQHQELLLMDIKHNFAIDPNFPCYQESTELNSPSKSARLQFIETEGGLIDIGYKQGDFCFDNELPVHKKFLSPYAIATQLVTNGEYLAFIKDGGYEDPRWWLADGWDTVLKNHWQAPNYWHNQDNEWLIFTLNGLKPLDEQEPVSHISFYEADAYARWCGARLPLEEEWEHFVNLHNLDSTKANFMETGLFHPQAASNNNGALAQQFFGELWEWTASPYSAYPGYTPLSGELAEYNGKFMTNQMVLRGGSCATPASHIRSSYRNFFQPEKRWQFSGIRLAKSINKG
ncbi:Iron(II)-dependent oxidoreductase EgtB [Legionella massiliensis]|uniref:Iron(II)-dependent oxidoreductase EgtB n=1 Tax=Legionella massiliensis TaxID=1034943 RepID=A0A078KVR0_9GAMM|nr:ergothioneine biosynthesis protein EgtB [Legionella massiliensis]CDZ78515.1 Iron(II)-dependent oxidoreductase EgtB [Legionella massiliensis]CEE14253.1 Iron(II)-dependent oxidoreductase EgtB [Legionella massiliensis]